MFRFSKSLVAGLVALFVLGLAARPAHAQFTINLTTSLPSGQPVGTEVELEASVASGVGLPFYQFSVRRLGGAWRVVRDFSVRARLPWVTLEEGLYQLKVSAFVLPTGATDDAIVPFAILPRATSAPVVTATAHPLVALFSAQPCVFGELSVRFRAVGDPLWQSTTTRPCSRQSINLYIAGMRGGTTYQMQPQWHVGAGTLNGPSSLFTSGVIDVTLPAMQVFDPVDSETSLEEHTLLHANAFSIFGTNFPFAVDLNGNVIWYYDEPSDLPNVTVTVYRPLPGGTMLTGVDDLFKDQILREIDLAGNLVRETSASAVSWQLIAMGEDPITSIHHEATRLPNGHTAVIASVERILTDVQGPGDVNVYGEMIVVLDEDFQVVWAWNSFDHLDTTRMALLGEVCESEGGGCPPLFQGETANDWLHANSLGYDPSDGSLLISMRHQDWVSKIDYGDGAGTGDVIWNLGQDGDFALVDASGDPWPWFSHQHDARLWDGDTLALYDNGNVRVEGPAGIGGNSRGQAYVLDENTMVATLAENFDLGDYAFALGSAQKLANGNYHFNSGWYGGFAAANAHSIEMSAATGLPTFDFQVSTSAVYRSFRLPGFYWEETAPAAAAQSTAKTSASRGGGRRR